MKPTANRPGIRRTLIGLGSFSRHLGALAVIAGLGIMGFGGMATSVKAQSAPSFAGMDRALVAKELHEKHAEKPVGMGLGANGGVVELFTSEDGVTWTLIMTMPNGKSFIVGAGEYWANTPVTAKGEKI